MAGAVTPALTLSEAAKATGKHRNTLRNALAAGRFPNAYRDEAGAWRVPVTDLIAAGFIVAMPSPEDGAEAVTEDVDAVHELRQRLAVAEALADERRRELERLTLELERLWSRVPPALPARAIRWPWSKNRD